MKAKAGVLDHLNGIVKAELTAVHQSLLHGALCKHGGYERLHEHFEYLAQEEVGHSSGLIDHILFLEGTPDVDHLDAVSRGWTVAELFTSDLNFERDDVELLRKTIAHCAKVLDCTTGHKLEDMVKDSQEHVDWFETQLRAIDQVEFDHYLSEQIKK
ncbi:MAG: bacterioferritin [Nitrospira sp.]|nr:bacterioferritin [Nitrospira sp.]